MYRTLSTTSATRRVVVAVFAGGLLALLANACLPKADRNCGGTDICNGRDDDCDGKTDEAFVSGSCVASVGVCAPGKTSCDHGQVVCRPERDPAKTDPSGGGDEDCDGTLDEDAPDANGPPVDAGIALLRDDCNGEDDNHNGQVDEDFSSTPCTASTGACSVGLTRCEDGKIVCVSLTNPASGDACDGIDNDCDGEIDEDVPGESCVAGLGICAEGTLECSDGNLVCAPLRSPQDEHCDGIDDNCDGAVDVTLDSGEQACRCEPIDFLAAEFSRRLDPFEQGCSPERCTETPSVACAPGNAGAVDTAFCFTCPDPAAGSSGTTGGSAGEGGCNPSDPPYSACNIAFTGDVLPSLDAFDHAGNGSGVLRVAYRLTSAQPIHAQIRLWVGVPAGDADAGILRKHFILEEPPVTGDGLEHVKYILPGDFCYPNWLACEGDDCASCDGDTCGKGSGEECTAVDLSTLNFQLTVEGCKSAGINRGDVALTSIEYIPESCLCASDADCGYFTDRPSCQPAEVSRAECASGVPCKGICAPAE